MSQQLLDVLKQQRRQRRLRFWLGFLAILLLGGLWAQLSKDPIGPAFGDDFIIEAEPDGIFFEDDAPAIEVPAPITTLAPTTAVEAPETTPAVPTTTLVAPETTLSESTTTVTEP